MTDVAITQADREAFARMEGHEPDDMGWRMITEPTQGDCAGVYAFARHRQAALSAIDPVALVQAGIDAAAAECAKQREDFLSPQYAVGQPISSMMERFACDECGNAIRALSASDVLKEMCGE